MLFCFVIVVPKYLNFATFSNDSSAVLIIWSYLKYDKDNWTLVICDFDTDSFTLSMLFHLKEPFLCMFPW